MKFIIFLSILTALSGSLRAQEYFQQETDYLIHVTLDDSLHQLTGNIEIRYTNNSPDELQFIYFHLWPNAYQNSSTALGEQLLEMKELALYNASDEEKGFIDRLDMEVNNKKAVLEMVAADVGKLLLPEPLKPGQKIVINTPFRVKIPSGEISRLGHVGQSYQITQWYPKPAVYDHKGWHEMPYLTQGEFYSEFGSFEVFITLPENYTVGATGDLQTEEELQRLNELDKLTRQKKFDKKDMSFPPSSSKQKTLHYKQDNVHDFAWFADKRYHVLKGEVELPHSKRKVTTWSLFTDNEAMLWQRAPEYLADATYYYSLWLGDYPYNQVTAVDGTISAGGGMEYPNVTVIGASGNAKGLETVIVHEVGHNWFYGILGSNERQHPWMDEGLNSFYENRYFETKYPGMKLSDLAPGGLGKRFDLDQFKRRYYNELMYLFKYRQNEDQPVELPAPEYSTENYGAIVYAKSALIVDHLMNYMGEELFDKSMQSYYEKWKFKHPYPENLRESFVTETGYNLDWFFDTLVETILPVDYSVVKVRNADCVGKPCFQVKVKNEGKVNAPFSISAMKGDSVIRTTWFSPFAGKQWLTMEGEGAERLRIDADENMVETNRKNNSIRTSGLFRKTEKLQLKFLGSPENPYRTQIYFSPVLGINANDLLMPGVVFYNSIVPRKKLEYILMPMFSTGRRDLVGMGQLNYRILPRRGFIKELDIRLDGKRFHADFFQFTKLQPSLVAYLQKPARSFTDVGFRYRTIITDTPFDPPIMTLASYDTRNIFHRLEIMVANDNPLHPKGFEAFVEAAETHVKAFGEFTLAIPYLKLRKQAEIRFFAGSFLYESSFPDAYNYSFRLDGNHDYLFDHVLLGRGEQNFLGQQLVPNDGQFKHVVNLPGSTSWISGANAMVELPFLRTALYGDAGFTDVQGKVHFAWDAGVALILVRDIAEVYFPIAMSSDLNMLSYGEKIRFMINFAQLNPFERLRKLEF